MDVAGLTIALEFSLTLGRVQGFAAYSPTPDFHREMVSNPPSVHTCPLTRSPCCTDCLLGLLAHLPSLDLSGGCVGGAGHARVPAARYVMVPGVVHQTWSVHARFLNYC